MIEDRWVEITGFGDPAPRYLLAQDGREATIEQAKSEYVYDRIDLEELEARVEAALRGKTITPRGYLSTQKMMVLPKGATTHLQTNGHSYSDHEIWGTVSL